MLSKPIFIYFVLSKVWSLFKMTVITQHRFSFQHIATNLDPNLVCPGPPLKSSQKLVLIFDHVPLEKKEAFLKVILNILC